MGEELFAIIQEVLGIESMLSLEEQSKSAGEG